SEVEHILFHRRRFPDLLAPSLVDIDVASRAGARAAALRLNLRNTVIDGRLHDSGTDLALDGTRSACGIDIGNFDHSGTTSRRFRRGNASGSGGIAAAWFYRLAVECASRASNNSKTAALPPRGPNLASLLSAQWQGQPGSAKWGEPDQA